MKTAGCGVLFLLVSRKREGVNENWGRPANGGGKMRAETGV